MENPEPVREAEEEIFERAFWLGAGASFVPPTPVFEEKFGGFLVVFNKDIYTEGYPEELGLNERQIKAVMYVKEKGKITNKEYQELNKVSNKTAYLELTELTKKTVLVSEGKGKSIKYILKVT